MKKEKPSFKGSRFRKSNLHTMDYNTWRFLRPPSFKSSVSLIHSLEVVLIDFKNCFRNEKERNKIRHLFIKCMNITFCCAKYWKRQYLLLKGQDSEKASLADQTFHSNEFLDFFCISEIAWFLDENVIF